MYRVDWGIVVVPRDEQRGSLHGDGHSSSMPPETAESRETGRRRFEYDELGI